MVSIESFSIAKIVQNKLSLKIKIDKMREIGLFLLSCDNTIFIRIKIEIKIEKMD